MRREKETAEQASKISDPSTSPSRRLEEDLPVDSNLLSPQLNRLQFDPPQELDDTPITALR